jgi:RHS repeat-associated protein
VTKYYFAGTTRIAMRKYTIPQNMSVEYFLGDHLGSTSITTDTNGAKVSEMRYKPWGEIRYSWTAGLSTTPVYELAKYTFTGQYSYTTDFGLMYYNARWYDPVSGRMAQADTIVPGGVQGLDRYAFVNNNPVNYTDPSGHCALKPGMKCPTNPKVTIPKSKRLSITLGTYVGDNYPKSQLERQEDIYEGGPVELLDSESQAAEDKNISSNANVYTTLIYNQDRDCYLDIVSVSVDNYSNYNVTVEYADISADADPVSSVIAPKFANDQDYAPNPLRIQPRGENGLMKVESQTSKSMLLTPSGNPSNPNNRFNLNFIDRLIVSIHLRYLPYPHRNFVIFDLTP